MLMHEMLLHPALLDGLNQWIAQWRAPIKTVGSSVIAVVAVCIIGVLIAKAIAAGKKQRMQDVVKPVAFAIVVALIALMGVGGLIHLIDSVGVGNDTGVQMNNPLQ